MLQFASVPSALQLKNLFKPGRTNEQINAMAVCGQASYDRIASLQLSLFESVPGD